MSIPSKHPFVQSFTICDNMKRLFCILLLFAGTTARAEELDSYGGFTDIRGEKTGFFHTEKIDDRWWLVMPEGNAFFLGGAPMTSSLAVRVLQQFSDLRKQVRGQQVRGQ